MAGPAVDLGLQGGRWQLYRDPPRPPPVGVTVGGNGGDALRGKSAQKNHMNQERIAMRITKFSINC